MTAVFTPLAITLKVSLVATAIAVVCGVISARLLGRRPFPGKDGLEAILTLPLVMPPTVLGYYLIVLVGRKGLFGQYLWDYFGITLMFTWQGAAVAAAVVAFPLVFKSARAAFDSVPHDLEDAARTLGSSELVIFIRVSLPLALRGVLAGSMLAMARAMGEFGATLMVAGNLPGKTQTLPLAVYSAVQAGDDTTANILVAVISVTCITLLIITARLVKPK
ncbi:molybdate ABC transporter permease subunit [Desulfovibrio inopinatus]|uniref:molybdate ABC transporter permease subunit n=1 Tax=Desulfovibrio inopinatus TaxID=102109 RepID=UPI00041F8284|nr:molybdate ABC transporter permease subunit [Desulfovibrio inopinatus]